MRLRALAPALAVLLACSGGTKAQDTVLTLPQARGIAVEALRNGNAALAAEMANGLIVAEPRAAYPHAILARAHQMTGDHTAARKSAARAFALAPPGPDRFVMGQLAARTAVAADRPGLAQFWLRRTAIHAPEAAKAAIAEDYSALRRMNPLSFRLDASLRPSSNVNNGSETAFQVIDGVPVTGALSGAAQALSGTVGSLDLNLRYRLHATDDALTAIGARLYSRRVALSDSAKGLAPTAANRDFSADFGEVSLQHGFAAGRDRIINLSMAAGQAAYGGRSTFRFVRTGAEHSWLLQDDARFSFGVALENRNGVASSRFDARALSVGLQFARPMANGDRLTLALGLRDTDAVFVNDRARAISLRAGYGLGAPVGAVSLSGALSLGFSDFPDYMSGFIVVPGGRQETSIQAEITARLDRMDYAGFVPELSLRAGRTGSNDSRFDTRELSVAIGIGSKF